ncbi:glycosyltransferase family 2 protein [Patescibacteria group bacterium]|nr:glycosyltransferase family 2 protein [Patescibacteria group bacterium]MBU1256824.1 glycosyltransferase family 2 protein [Patescibacteria group bacterium]MBU1457330.1 glycosyltransferase family 2 protein [Patescibacteria group bacterium]
MKLSVIILNHLPTNLLKPTLKSVSFADEILIIQDSSSCHSDSPLRHSEHSEESRRLSAASLRFARSFAGLRMTRPIRVFTRSLTNFAKQRNLALKKAKTDWVLFVDSDEIVPKKLAQEIKQAIKSQNYQGYLLPRQDVILGQVLKHGETGSIKLLRLARKSAGKFSRSVHEIWNIQGRVGELKTPLLHIKENFTFEFLKRIGRYGPIDSSSLIAENKPFSYSRLLLNPPAKFIQNYIVRRGIQDGLLGLFHAYLMSVQSLSVRVFQWQNNHPSPSSPHPSVIPA